MPVGDANVIEILPSAVAGVRRMLLRSDAGAIVEAVELTADRLAALPSGGMFSPIEVRGSLVVLGPPLQRRLVELKPPPLVVLGLLVRLLDDLELLHRGGGAHGALALDGLGVDERGQLVARPVLHVAQELSAIGDVRAVGSILGALADRAKLEASGVARASLLLSGLGVGSPRAGFGDARAARQALAVVVRGLRVEDTRDSFFAAVGVSLPPPPTAFRVRPVSAAVGPVGGGRAAEARAWLDRSMVELQAARFDREAALGAEAERLTEALHRQTETTLVAARAVAAGEAERLVRSSAAPPPAMLFVGAGVRPPVWQPEPIEVPVSVDEEETLDAGSADGAAMAGLGAESLIEAFRSHEGEDARTETAERVEAERAADEEALYAAEEDVEEGEAAGDAERAAEEEARVEVERAAAATEAARLEAERAAEAAAVAAANGARAEAERAANRARVEAERLAAEEARLEAERRAAEAERVAAEAAKVERERLAAEAARIEAERLAAEDARVEAERLAAQEAERLAAEEAARIAAEAAWTAAERVAAEEAARIAAEAGARVERERLAAEAARIEAERLEASAAAARLEAERLAAEEAALAAEETARVERERLAAEEARLEAERLEAAAAAARLEAERLAAEEAALAAAEEAVRVEAVRVAAARASDEEHTARRPAPRPVEDEPEAWPEHPDGVADDADRGGVARWEGLGGVRGDPSRMNEKGPGKWTSQGRSREELAEQLPPGESRPMDMSPPEDAGSRLGIYLAVAGVVALLLAWWAFA